MLGWYEVFMDHPLELLKTAANKKNKIKTTSNSTFLLIRVQIIHTKKRDLYQIIYIQCSRNNDFSKVQH